MDGQVIQPFSMGLFLVRLPRGSQIKMEQVRVDDGIWMPERVEGHAAAKILFVNSLVVERTLTYSEYKPPQPGYARREMIRRFRWLHGAGGKDCGEY